jgi:hypothetical protein
LKLNNAAVGYTKHKTLVEMLFQLSILIQMESVMATLCCKRKKSNLTHKQFKKKTQYLRLENGQL